MENALKMLEEMKKQDTQPEVVSTALLFQVLEDMVGRGITLDIFTYSNFDEFLLRMELLLKLINWLIFCKLGKWEEVNEVFDEILDSEIYFNAVVFDILIDTCCRGMVGKASQLLDVMNKGCELHHGYLFHSHSSWPIEDFSITEQFKEMAAAVGRAIDSFFSTIYYSVRYPTTNHHPRTQNQAYRHSTNQKSANTHYLGTSKEMAKGKPLSLQTVELKVRMCCSGCERVVKNAIMKLRGIDTVDVNLELGKVTVTGYVDPNRVLKEVRRHGKKAEFWPNPDLPLYFTSVANYFNDEETFRESYNYWKHGYNGDKHGQMRATQRGEDRVSNMFNDDDVNACSVM